VAVVAQPFHRRPPGGQEAYFGGISGVFTSHFERIRGVGRAIRTGA